MFKVKVESTEGFKKGGAVCLGGDRERWYWVIRKYKKSLWLKEVTRLPKTVTEKINKKC